MAETKQGGKTRSYTLFSSFKKDRKLATTMKNDASIKESLSLRKRRKGIILISLLMILLFIYIFPWRPPKKLHDPDIKPHDCIRAGSLVLPNQNRARITSWSSLYYSQHSFYFRTYSKNGLMLYEADESMQTNDFLAIQLRKRKVEFLFNSGQGTVLLTGAPGKGHWTDGKWHLISASRLGTMAELSVDGVLLVKTQLNTHRVHAVDSTSGLHVGGIPRRFYSKVHKFVVKTDFRGCIGNITLNGRKWDPSQFLYLKSQSSNGKQISGTSNRNDPSDINQDIGTPVVTAAYEAQLKDLKKMIASIQFFSSNTKIIVYDLGLSEKSKEKIKKYCNVKLLDFPFTNYPKHFQNSKLEAWRPVIVKSNLQHYGSVVYMDPDVVLKRRYNELIRNTNKTHSGFGFRTMNEPVTAFTHPGMINALGQSIAHYQSVPMIDTRFLVFTGSRAFQLVTEWARCTADIDCILPSAASLGSCLPQHIRPPPQYRECHLASRSALSVINYKNQSLRDRHSWNREIKKTTGSSSTDGLQQITKTRKCYNLTSPKRPQATSKKTLPQHSN